MKALLILTIVALAGLTACTKTEHFSRVNKNKDNVAIQGFDSVAYFAAESAVKGDAKYEFVWNGAKWLFSSAENLEKFRASPEQYAPQFGGYCSFAVSKGYTANGDPNAWKIVDGKLYLNYSPKVKEMWESDQESRIKEGENNWKKFDTQMPEHKN